MAVTFKLKNNTVSPILIEEMGLTIAGSSSVDLLWERIDDLASSTELISLLNSGTIILNNGSDLTAAQALLFLNYELGYSGMYSPISHNHTKSQITDFAHDHNTLYYTQAQIDSLKTTINYAFVTANSSSQTNVTALELETLTNGSNADALHKHAGTGTTLNAAYLSGNTVTTTAGPVILSGASGNAPLRLSNLAYPPTANLVGGEMCYSDGEMWFYDQTRSKWLSIGIINVPFNVNQDNTSGYMFYGVVQNTSESGFSMPWPGTIVGLSANTQTAASSTIDIRVSTSSVFTSSWNAGGGLSAIETDINEDFDILDEIQIYLNTGGQKPKKPNVTLFVRRRLT